MMLMQDITGDFIRSMPVTVSYTLLASLLIALTLTPLLSEKFMSKNSVSKERKARKFLNKFVSNTYKSKLQFALDHPKTIIISAVIFFLISLSLFPLVGISFFPKAEKPLFMININLPEGSSISKTEKVANYVEENLMKKEEVINFTTNIGNGNPRIYYNVVSKTNADNYAQIFVELKEYNYDDIKDKKKQSFTKNKVDWLGITDKYWLAAFIPDSLYHYSSNFIYGIKSGMDKYQADLISTAQIIEPGGSFELTHKLFAGAKKVDLLDKYENQYNIKLFDRAIDFGWFYILTKPIFNAMNFFYLYVGNFGISIMIVTIIIKLAMFTLANKSYRSMKKMKNLQPQMERLKELYADDKARLNQEIMNLYKKEKVNPVSGCLPLLIQIPVFFSIYKVLYVTIEMRHAPFFGWIKD
ncbi:MAG: membrane protein insertase YidC, partial [Bacteroidetes bacterium]|nr:membrane protein insertase YidC [Bacteroidota bacterium]